MSLKLASAANAKVRYNLDVPCAVDARIQELAEKHQMTKTDLIRTAVKFFAECDALEQEGYQTASTKVDEKGNRETVRHLVH